MIDWESDPELQKLRAEFVLSLQPRLRELQRLRNQLEQSKKATETVASIVTLSHRLAGAAETYGFSTLTQVSGMLDDYLTLGGQRNPSQEWIGFLNLLEEALDSAIQTKKDPSLYLSDPRMKKLTSDVEYFLSATKP